MYICILCIWISAFPSLTGNVVALKHGGKLVNTVEEGAECGLVLDRTCFYAVGGGQTSDVGHVDSGQVCECGEAMISKLALLDMMQS